MKNTSKKINIFEVGIAYKKAGEYRKALVCFKKAVSIKGCEDDANINIMEMLLKTEAYEKALQFIAHVKISHQYNYQRYVFQAQCSQALGKCSEAIKYSIKAGMCAKEASDAQSVKKSLAHLYAQQKDFKRALGFIESLEKYDEIDDDMLLLKGICLKEQGNYDASLKCLAKVVEGKRRDMAGEIMGDIYVRQNKFSLGKAHYIKLLENANEKEQSYLFNYNLARLYVANNDYIGGRPFLLKWYHHVDEKKNIFLKNKLLNIIEYADKKTILKSKPIEMTLTITSKCNLKCAMCDTHKNNFDLGKTTADEIEKLFPYLEGISWLGGEVFLAKRFDHLFEQALRHKNIRTNEIITNGLLLTEKTIDKIVANKVKLTVSVDGVTKNIYEGIRKGGNFEVLQKKLHMISEAYSRTHTEAYVLQLNHVVLKSNYKDLIRLPDFARKYGFNRISLMRCIPSPVANNELIENDLAIMGYIKGIMPQVLDRAQKNGITMLLDRFYGNMAFNNGKKSSVQQSQYLDSGCDTNSAESVYGKREDYCNAPWKRFTLLTDGFVYPDCDCVVPAGGFIKQSIAETWNSSIMQQYRATLGRKSGNSLCNKECMKNKYYANNVQKYIL